MNVGTINVTNKGFKARIDPNLISDPYSLIMYLGNVESKFLNTHLTPVSSMTKAINLINALVQMILSIISYSILGITGDSLECLLIVLSNVSSRFNEVLLIFWLRMFTLEEVLLVNDKLELLSVASRFAVASI